MTTQHAGQAGSGEQFFDVEETHATGWMKGTVRYTWTQLLDTFEEGSLTRVIMDSHASLSAEKEALVKALGDLLGHYTQLVNSGDAGNWDPETEPVVIAACAALKGRP